METIYNIYFNEEGVVLIPEDENVANKSKQPDGYCLITLGLILLSALSVVLFFLWIFNVI